MSDLDLDALEALARAATPGPWQWVDPESDLPCLPDAPCSNPDHAGERHAYRFSLRTVDEHPTRSVGMLPRFIINTAEEFYEQRQEDGTYRHGDAALIAAMSPEVVLQLVALARQGAQARRAPVQRCFRTGMPAGTVGWNEHLLAYDDYRKRFPGSAATQSAERLAERGGFSYWELTDHLGHEPNTWEAT